MENYIVSPAPHLEKNNSTRKIMLTVVIALLPQLAVSTYVFGLNAIILTLLCVICCMGFEALFCLATKKPITIGDCSALVTGILLAFNLPVTMPYYMAIIGCFVAIVVVKMLFGGIGQNFANPALTARIVLLLSFTSQMTTWVKPFYYTETGFFVAKNQIDGVVSATSIVAEINELPQIANMLIGVRPGSLGETSAIALLAGGIFLIARKVINPVIPAVFLGSSALFSLIMGEDVLMQLLSGGIILAAFFMATDYSTSPITTKGKIIFAFGASLITFVIRSYANFPEGVSFGILLMNILTPHIDNLTRPKPFGTEKEAKR